MAQMACLLRNVKNWATKKHYIFVVSNVEECTAETFAPKGQGALTLEKTGSNKPFSLFKPQ